MVRVGTELAEGFSDDGDDCHGHANDAVLEYPYPNNLREKNFVSTLYDLRARSSFGYENNSR